MVSSVDNPEVEDEVVAAMVKPRLGGDDLDVGVGGNDCGGDRGVEDCCVGDGGEDDYGADGDDCGVEGGGDDRCLGLWLIVRVVVKRMIAW